MAERPVRPLLFPGSMVESPKAKTAGMDGAGGEDAVVIDIIGRVNNNEKQWNMAISFLLSIASIVFLLLWNENESEGDSYRKWLMICLINLINLLKLIFFK